ncbi:MAG: hypothetical protein ACO32I_06530 [Candidatus Limnocylindrus sp.]
MINTAAVLKVLEIILSNEVEIDPDTPMTPEMGALIRDKGKDRALDAADLRRRIGEFTDLARCAEFTVGKHRRRLKR